MAATASQNLLSLTLQQMDINNVNILQPRAVGPVTYTGFAGQFQEAILTGTGATVLPFPVGLTNALQVYIKNTTATGNVTINLTPLAATGSVIVAKLLPGAVFAYWAPSSGSSGGYSAATGTADTPNCTLEYFIGG